MSVVLTVRRGGLYLDRAAYDRYFPGLETVILLRRNDDLLLLPARSAVAGGFMLKLRNAAGDRVVHAAEFFRAQGIEDHEERTFTFAWSAAGGGLVCEGAFALQT